MLPPPYQQTRENEQRHTRSDPPATRDGDTDSRQEGQGCIAQEDPQQMPNSSGYRVSQSDRHEHFQKTGQVIGANVSSRGSVAVASRLDEVPNVLRVGRKLVNGIHRDGHSQKNQDATEE